MVVIKEELLFQFPHPNVINNLTAIFAFMVNVHFAVMLYLCHMVAVLVT